ncbi:hypothetical protein PMAYCL1PPCAC_32153, partial [Pristionchus mayeri]
CLLLPRFPRTRLRFVHCRSISHICFLSVSHLCRTTALQPTCFFTDRMSRFCSCFRNLVGSKLDTKQAGNEQEAMLTEQEKKEQKRIEDLKNLKEEIRAESERVMREEAEDRARSEAGLPPREHPEIDPVAPFLRPLIKRKAQSQIVFSSTLIAHSK